MLQDPPPYFGEPWLFVTVMSLIAVFGVTFLTFFCCEFHSSLTRRYLEQTTTKANIYQERKMRHDVDVARRKMREKKETEARRATIAELRSELERLRPSAWEASGIGHGEDENRIVDAAQFESESSSSEAGDVTQPSTSTTGVETVQPRDGDVGILATDSVTAQPDSDGAATPPPANGASAAPSSDDVPLRRRQSQVHFVADNSSFNSEATSPRGANPFT